MELWSEAAVVKDGIERRMSRAADALDGIMEAVDRPIVDILLVLIFCVGRLNYCEVGYVLT